MNGGAFFMKMHFINAFINAKYAICCFRSFLVRYSKEKDYTLDPSFKLKWFYFEKLQQVKNYCDAKTILIDWIQKTIQTVV